MRPIKFEIKLRRKDGSDGYYEHLTLDDLLNRNGCLYHPGLWEVVYKRQFTGLHDKNGKEIYEGDIVMYCEIEYKIIYQANEFHCGYYLAYMFEDNSCLELGKQRTNIIEVIGNIYEKEQ